jgi:hypothetical protein
MPEGQTEGGAPYVAYGVHTVPAYGYRVRCSVRASRDVRCGVSCVVWGKTHGAGARGVSYFIITWLVVG